MKTPDFRYVPNSANWQPISYAPRLVTVATSTSMQLS